MFPRQSMHRAPYGLLTDTIGSRYLFQLLTIGMALADRYYAATIQLCAVVLPTVYGVLRPALEYLPPLCCHVLRVRRVISQEQVIGANTQRIVAMMTYHRVFRNRAIVQLPRYARRLLHIAQVVDRSISVGILKPRPFPTPRRNLDLGPKAILDRARAGRQVIAKRAATQRTVAGAGRMMGVHVDVLSVWPCVTRSIPQFS